MPIKYIEVSARNFPTNTEAKVIFKNITYRLCIKTQSSLSRDYVIIFEKEYSNVRSHF